MENVDAWGNLRGDPHRVVEEAQGGNTIKVMIYQVGNAFCYGFQLKVGALIRQRAANINGAVFRSEGAAREAAGKEIEAVCGGNKNSRKFFADFQKIRYTDCDLFGGIV